VIVGCVPVVLPVSALISSAALGVADVTPGRLAAVGVVALGITVGGWGGGAPPAPAPAPAGT
jgi:hypothetical protein